MDLSVFGFFHSVVGQSSLLDGLVVFIAEHLLYFLVLGAIFFIFNMNTVKEKIFAFIFISLTAVLSRGILTETIRFFYDRDRPFEILGLEPLFTDFAPAFPSGHSAFLFAIAVAIFYFSRFWGFWFLGFSFLVGISRVAAGVHWPLDILGGIGVALASFVIVERLLRKHRPRSV